MDLSKKLYVGNVPFTATEGDLRTLFEQYGTVEQVNVIIDRETSRPRGFAFVEMTDLSAAGSATRALDGQAVSDGRALRVNGASDRTVLDGRSSQL